jgi:hypothetical protein
VYADVGAALAEIIASDVSGPINVASVDFVPRFALGLADALGATCRGRQR